MTIGFEKCWVLGFENGILSSFEDGIVKGFENSILKSFKNGSWNGIENRLLRSFKNGILESIKGFEKLQNRILESFENWFGKSWKVGTETDELKKVVPESGRVDATLARESLLPRSQENSPPNRKNRVRARKCCHRSRKRWVGADSNFPTTLTLPMVPNIFKISLRNSLTDHRSRTTDHKPAVIRIFFSKKTNPTTGISALIKVLRNCGFPFYSELKEVPFVLL